jgi:hypothetical protein
MPSASGTGPDPDPAADPDSVLAAERAHLTAAREFLRLMREDVLSLRARAAIRSPRSTSRPPSTTALRPRPTLPDTLFFGRLTTPASRAANSLTSSSTSAAVTARPDATRW